MMFLAFLALGFLAIGLSVLVAWLLERLIGRLYP
jgi:hypothetical protein